MSQKCPLRWLSEFELCFYPTKKVFNSARIPRLKNITVIWRKEPLGIERTILCVPKDVRIASVMDHEHWYFPSIRSLGLGLLPSPGHPLGKATEESGSDQA